MLDIYSHKIFGWEVHARESADLATTHVQHTAQAEACTTCPLVLNDDTFLPWRQPAERHHAPCNCPRNHPGTMVNTNAKLPAHRCRLAKPGTRSNDLGNASRSMNRPDN